MKDKLDLIESRLQSLIEGSLTLLIPMGSPQQTLAHLLVQTMRANLITTQNGRIIAPSQYQVQAHPSRGQYWRANHRILDDLGKNLEQAGIEAGVSFNGVPAVTLLLDPSILPNDLRVVAIAHPSPLDETSNLPAQHLGPAVEGIPTNAFLIIDGARNYPLKTTVVNIGRRLDNHLVIDDPRVSRGHAQLRAIKGHYTIFDLNSTGGTFVNNQRVSQQVLKPGDVISLAGVPLIFGQDINPALGDTDNHKSPQEGPDPSKKTISPAK